MKHLRIIASLAFLICFLFFHKGVSAEITAGSYTLSPHIGGYIFDDDQDLDDGLVIGIGLGYNYTERIGVEAVFDHIDTEDEDTGRDNDASIFRIDGLYHFMPDKQLVPYVAAGLGAINTDGTHGLFNYGAGLKYSLSEELALRGDIRHLIDFHDTNNNLAYTIGLTYLFGGKEKAPPKPKDSDSDGVYDDMDICPDTPAGAPVDSKGCPLDSDGDGVYDYMDKCPGTLAGVKVDTNGCPILVKEKVSIQLNLEFDTDKALIRPVYHEQMEKVADFLKQYPETTAVIEGHTDNVGATEYNLVLSTKRADAVRKYLIDKFDIVPQRLAAKGYGESAPIADNNTKEGRQQNRRVLAVFSGMAIRN